mgnify:FL=1
MREVSDAGSRRISIRCGNGGMYLRKELLRGAGGAMTGFGYPEMPRHAVDAAGAGDIDRARDVFDAYLPMIRHEAQPGMGLAIRKRSLAWQVVIASPTLRKPGAGLSARAIAEVDALVARQRGRLDALGWQSHGAFPGYERWVELRPLGCPPALTHEHKQCRRAGVGFQYRVTLATKGVMAHHSTISFILGNLDESLFCRSVHGQHRTPCHDARIEQCDVPRFASSR